MEHGLGHFDFFGTENSLSGVPAGAVPLVDHVVQSSEEYTERKCRLLFFKIFKAFNALHQRNVVHRSIRREHIYVQPVSFVLCLEMWFEQPTKMRTAHFLLGVTGSRWKSENSHWRHAQCPSNGKWEPIDR